MSAAKDVADQTPAENPQLVAAVRQLMARLQRYRGAPMRKSTFDDINTLVKDHRRACRLRGVDFPPLTALVLVKVGAIELVRKDLEPSGLKVALFNITRKYPAVDKDELAAAVHWAFPWYRGSQVDLSACEIRMPRRRVNGHAGP